MQEALDLSADVQSQSLSPVDLMWSQRCPGVIELLQSVLDNIQKTTMVVSSCCRAASRLQNLDHRAVRY